MKAVPLLLLCLACAAPAEAQSNNSELSNASRMVGDGSVFVVYGSLATLAASANVVVKSVEAVGDGSVILVAGASDATEASIRLSGQAAKGLSIAVGTGIGVVAMSTGYLINQAGQVLAFVPNEVGKALLHHTRLSPGGN